MNIDKIEEFLDEYKHLDIRERIKIYNQISVKLYDFIQLNHPVLGVQLVHTSTVESNDYNPNTVNNPEMKLLQFSIEKDGMTLPVVVSDNEDGSHTIVDGFHRTSLIKGIPAINDSLHSYVPCVKLNKSIDDRITSTVRHNIARGTHQVELSANLITLLHKHNWTDEKIGREIGMDPDEVLRLKQITGIAELFKDQDFSASWNPEDIPEEEYDAS